MKKLTIILLALILTAGVAIAETTLTSGEAQPTIDRFEINQFKIDVAGPQVEIVVEFGYDSGGFVRERAEEILITNDTVYRNRRPEIEKVDGADPGIFDDFPAAYQDTPATKVVTEANGGTFGGEATLKAYLETIVKTLLGL